MGTRRGKTSAGMNRTASPSTGWLPRPDLCGRGHMTISPRSARYSTSSIRLPRPSRGPRRPALDPRREPASRHRGAARRRDGPGASGRRALSYRDAAGRRSHRRVPNEPARTREPEVRTMSSRPRSVSGLSPRTPRWRQLRWRANVYGSCPEGCMVSPSP